MGDVTGNPTSMSTASTNIIPSHNSPPAVTMPRICHMLFHMFQEIIV